MKKTILSVVVMGLLLAVAHAGRVLDFQPSPDDKAAWMNEDKYGFFIVWGLYSSLGRGEWVMWNDKTPVDEYKQLADNFNPQNFDARRWARIAKDAGMKYVVITAKFHDGFALFETDVSDFNVMDASPFKRDVIQEMKEACDAEGLKLGLYYSHDQDWCNWGGTGSGRFVSDRTYTSEDFLTYVDTIAIPQVTELCEQYQPDMIWFDTPRKMNAQLGRKFTAAIQAVNPNIIVNSRLLLDGNKAQKATREQRDVFRDVGVDFVSYADREIPAASPWPYWETCMTLNDSWGYTQHDNNWKSPERVIQQLIEVVSKGGTFLLAVGPDKDGVVSDQAVENLRVVGDWLKVNGDAVYGAVPTAFDGPGAPTKEYLTKKANAEKREKKLGREIHVPVEMAYEWLATGQDGKMYISLFEWPGESLELDNFEGRIKDAFILSDPDAKLKTTLNEKKLTVNLPENPVDALVPVLCLVKE
jgi:alpha-L-fucosidase